MWHAAHLGVALRDSWRKRVVADGIVAAVASLLALAPAGAYAGVNGTWTRTTSGGLWSTQANWSGGTVATGTDGIADFSTLNITADETVHLDSARTIGQLKFGDTTPSNNWILDNDGNAADILTLAVSSGAPTITVNNDTATISAVVAGTQGFTKNGAGTLLLSGSNTYSGITTISAGTLMLGNASALGSTAGGTTISIGATLDLNAQAIGGEGLTISGTGVGGNGTLINSSGSSASWLGTIGASAVFSVGGTGDIILSGSVNSLPAFVLTKIGNNTLTLSGTTDNSNLGATVNSGMLVLAKTSSHSPDVHSIGQATLTAAGGIAQLGGTGGDQIFDLGNVTVTSGAFDTNGRSETFATLSLQGTGIGNAGALVNSAAAASTITPTNGTTLTANATIGVTQSGGTITLNNTIGGSFGLTKVGAGTLMLAGNNTFTGGLTINAGNVQLGNAGALNSSSPSSVTFGASSTGTLSLNGNSVTIGDLNGGSSSAVQNGSGTFASLTVNVNGPHSDSFAGVLKDGGTGGLSLEKTGAGSLTLAGNNTFSGEVAIDAGTLVLANANAVSGSSIGQVFNGGTLDLGGQIVGANVAEIDFDGAGVGGLGALINSSGSAASFGGFIDNNFLRAFSVGGAGDITLSGGVFVASATQSTSTLTKLGSNTLILGGSDSNRFLALTVNSGAVVLAKQSTNAGDGVHAVSRGPLLVNGGTVRLGGAGGDQIEDGIDTTVASGAAFDTNGRSETFDGLTLTGTGIAGSGALVNSAAGASVLTLTQGTSLTGNTTIGVTQTAGSLTLNDSIGPAQFGLTKVGAGTLVLGGVNNFNGLTVQQGTLQVSSVNDAGSNGPLGRGSSVTLGTAGLSGAGQPIGTLEYAGNNPASTTMPFSIPASNGAFQVDTAGTNLTLSGTISGSGELIKVGAGTLILSGNNTFSGQVIINAGVLQAGSASAINANSSVSFGGSSGTFSVFGHSLTVTNLIASGPQTVSILTENNGLAPATLTLNLPAATTAVYGGVVQDGGSAPLAVVISGGGTEFIAGSSNSFTGGLTVQQGTLEILTINDANTFGSLGNNTSVTLGSSGQTGMLELASTKPIPSSDMPFTLAAGGTGAYQVDNAATNLTLFGVVSGSGGLIKSGPGTLTLASNNTFTGHLTLQEGTLTLAGSNRYTGGTIVTIGTLNTTSTGNLAPGPLTLSAANGITSAVNLGNTQTVSSLSGTIASTGSATLNIGSGVTLTVDQSSGDTAFQGLLVNSGTFAKSGTSTLEISGAPTLNANAMLMIKGGRLRLSNSASATIGTGVTATVASDATLELAGSVSGLSSGAHRVDIMNSSNSAGLLVSGTHQQVGGIDGLGTTQVNAGSDLTADHIIQTALVIGGTSTDLGSVTIAASDASGNALDLGVSGPLGQPSGVGQISTLTAGGSFPEGSVTTANLSSSGNTDPQAVSTGNLAPIGSRSPVPEPTTLLLALLATIGMISTQFVRNHFRWHNKTDPLGCGDASGQR